MGKNFRWSRRMNIEILKDVISTSAVIMNNLEKVSKYQLSHMTEKIEKSLGEDKNLHFCGCEGILKKKLSN
jgi:hypothetical protein